MENQEAKREPVTLTGRALWIESELEKKCPENDCRLYLNVCNMRRNVLQALEAVPGGWGRAVLVAEANRLARQLEHMARTNYAVRNFAAEQRRLERQEGEAQQQALESAT